MNRLPRSQRAKLLAGALGALAAGCFASTPAYAQEVVQALPPPEAAELNAALRRLAARPTDLEALVTAGEASLVLNDAAAAAGFFARAAAVAPGDRRVLLGQARVALEQQRPVAALQSFAQAERAGARPLDMAADRALAYDLVGDNAAAQALYRSVLADDDDNEEVRRRLALSLAIAGNRSEFERVLYPLLRDEDRAAYRTRAFGLAVLGRPDDAVAIADAMMPTDLALRMAPYLRYMPRLTKAQQAAAGNLGAFPAAAEIGRDSAEIANYARAGARVAANASASLTPTGAPLGPRPQSQLTPTASSAVTPVRVAGPPAPSPRPAATPTAALVARPIVVADPGPAAVPSPSQPVTQSSARSSLAEAFADLKPASPNASGAAPGAVDIAKLTPARPRPVAKPAAEKPEAKPKVEKPSEPSRIWVQLGVGRNTGAFAFDWRKLAKEAGGALEGKGPWAAKYGATNRMLAGPYPTEAAARATIKRLKEKQIDAIPFTSDDGEKVTRIG